MQIETRHSHRTRLKSGYALKSDLVQSYNAGSQPKKNLYNRYKTRLKSSNSLAAARPSDAVLALFLLAAVLASWQFLYNSSSIIMVLSLYIYRQ